MRTDRGLSPSWRWRCWRRRHTAFEVDVSTTPSTTQAAGHPGFTVADHPHRDGRRGPAGSAARPASGLDRQPRGDHRQVHAWRSSRPTPVRPGARSGSVEAVATALVLSLPPVPGSDLCARARSRTTPRTLGIVLRPPAPAADRQALLGQPHQDLRDRRRRLRACATSSWTCPARSRCCSGLPVDITLQSLTLTLNSTAAGGFFMTNPDQLQARAHRREGSLLPRPRGNGRHELHAHQLRGGAVRPVARLHDGLDRDQLDQDQPTITINLPADDDPLAQSHVSNVIGPLPARDDPRHPEGVQPSASAPPPSSWRTHVPPGSRLGTATVSVPVLPPDFTGDVYRINPPVPARCSGSASCCAARVA